MKSLGEFDDIMQLARLALIGTIDRHNKSVPLGAFIWNGLKWEMLDIARKAPEIYRPDFAVMIRDLYGRTGTGGRKTSEKSA